MSLSHGVLGDAVTVDPTQDQVGVPLPTSLIDYDQLPDERSEGGVLVAFLRIPPLQDRNIH
jgi:hypothetical protein